MLRTGRSHVKRVEPMSNHSSQPPRAIARVKGEKLKGEKRAGDRVFQVAADLFYKQSIRAVGVETIVKQAGVAKISLYRNFESKDDLIVAYLKNRNAAYWDNIDRMVAKRGNPRDQLRALIAYIARRTTTPGYRGCPFINYVAEFPDAAHPGHQIAEENKQEMRRRLVDLTKAIGVDRPAQLADALFLLIEGAYASSQTLGGRNGPAANLSWAAEALLQAHTNAGQNRPL
jgi:AcrR family transcriptional regulator